MSFTKISKPSVKSKSLKFISHITFKTTAIMLLIGFITTTAKIHASIPYSDEDSSVIVGVGAYLTILVYAFFSYILDSCIEMWLKNDTSTDIIVFITLFLTLVEILRIIALPVMYHNYITGFINIYGRIPLLIMASIVAVISVCVFIRLFRISIIYSSIFNSSVITLAGFGFLFNLVGIFTDIVCTAVKIYKAKKGS